MARCFECNLPDPYNGCGDGIGSCECPRCEHCGGPPGVCDCEQYDEGDGCDSGWCGYPDCACTEGAAP